MDERDLTWWTHDIWTLILKWGLPGCTHFTSWKPLKLEASGISKSGSERGLRTRRPDPYPTPMLLVMALQSWPNKGLLYSWGHRPAWGQRCCPQNRIQKKFISLTVGPTEPTTTQLFAGRLRLPGRTSEGEKIYTHWQVGFTWTAQQDPPSVKPTSDKATHTQKTSNRILRGSLNLIFWPERQRLKPTNRKKRNLEKKKFFLNYD